jgi:hypothetical protein
VTVYKAAPGSNSPANVVRTVVAESERMALETVKAEVQRQNPKYTITTGSVKKIGN